MAFSNRNTSPAPALYGLHCTDGKGYRTDHRAEGYICAPDGDRIPGAMCRKDAEVVIAEYSAKLGEAWTFESATP